MGGRKCQTVVLCLDFVLSLSFLSCLERCFCRDKKVGGGKWPKLECTVVWILIIFPIIFKNGYEVSRIYWSASDMRRRSLYRCTIGENESVPEFSLTYANGDTEISVRGSSATGKRYCILLICKF